MPMMSSGSELGDELDNAVGRDSNAWPLWFGWRGGWRVESPSERRERHEMRRKERDDGGQFPLGARAWRNPPHCKSASTVDSHTGEEGVADWTAGSASLCARQNLRKAAGGGALAVTRWRFRVSLSHV